MKRPPLSKRELEVIAELVAGKSAPEAARALGLSYHTVQSYIKSAAMKLPGSQAPQQKLRAWGAKDPPGDSAPTTRSVRSRK